MAPHLLHRVFVGEGTQTTPELPFARAARIWLAGYATEVGGTWFFQWYAFPPLRMDLVLAATLIQVLALSACLRRAESSRRWALGYLACEAACQTVILYALGDLRIVVAPAVWTVILVLPGVRLSAGQHFGLANVFVGLYLMVAVAERADLLAPLQTPALTVDADLAMKLTVVMFLVVNVAALIVSQVRGAFERRDEDQERLILARTAELETSNRALRRKQEEFRAVSQIISHDLLSELGTILLSADQWWQEEGVAFTPIGTARFDDIVHGAGQARRMLDELLHVSDVTAAAEAPGWVDLDELVAGVRRQLAPHVRGKRIALVVGRLPPLWGRPKKLGHVLFNVVANAVKYVPAETGRIEIGGIVDGAATGFFVRDNGVGIPPQFVPRIWRLFGRAPEEHQVVDGRRVDGVGVGLALAKYIVELHGGAIELVSGPGRGTLVRVTLPLPTAAASRTGRMEGTDARTGMLA